MKKLIVAPALLLSLFMVSSINAAPKERLNDLIDKDNFEVEASSDDQTSNNGAGIGKQRYSNILEDNQSSAAGMGDEVTHTGPGTAKQRYNSGIMEQGAESNSSDAQ